MAEQVGFDSAFVSDHFQPWKHVDGHAPYSLAWLGALGARTSQLVMGTSVLTPTFRYHPSIVAQAFGTLGAMFPGPRDPGHRHRRVAERGAVDRRAVARVQGAVRPPARGGDPDPHAVARGARQLRGRVLRPRRPRSTTGPEIEVPIYVAAAGAAGGALCRPHRATASSAPAARSGSSTPRRCCPSVAEGIAAATEPQQAALRPHDRGQGLVRHRQASARSEDTRHWAALALTPEEKMSVEDPVEMQRLADALPLERAASRWIVSSDPDEQVEKIGAYVGLGFQSSRVPRAGPRPGALPQAVRRAGRCRGCARRFG